MDFSYYVKQQKAWSLKTFGEGQRSDGICKHIASELEEIKEHPSDLTEKNKLIKKNIQIEKGVNNHGMILVKSDAPCSAE